MKTSPLTFSRGAWLCAVTLAAAVLALGQTASAATYGVLGGAWATATTWSPNLAGGPLATDAITFTGGSTTLTLATTVQTVDSFAFNSAGSLDVASTVDGKTLTVTNNLTKDGSGTLFFRVNANIAASIAIGGNLTVNAGTLKTGDPGGLGASINVTGTTTVASAGTIDFAHHTDGNGNFNGGMLLDGTFKVATNYGFNPGVKISGLSGAGNYRISASTVVTTVRYSQLDLSPAAGSFDFSGVISDELSALHKIRVNKTGAGTQVLSGINTYDGTTTVTAGTLLINGDNSGAAGAVAVKTGATLGGSGTVGGATTVESGGILSAGNSPGTLTFASTLALSNGSTAIFEGGDLVNVTGQLTLTNNWTLQLMSGFQDGGSVMLFDYGTLAASPDLVPTFNVAGLGFTPTGPLTLTDNGSAIILNGISAVPEPATWLLLAFGLTVVVTLRRRRNA